MEHDAWPIYGNSGLLDINEQGHSGFTTNSPQYITPVKDNNGVLTQFSLRAFPAGGTQVITENGILVGTNGLNILNGMDVSKIVFQSLGDRMINLLGSVQIIGPQAELVFITPYKINCNGCNFPGVVKVTFCTIPNSSPLADHILQQNAGAYCLSSEANYLNNNHDVRDVVNDPGHPIQSGLEHWIKWGVNENRVMSYNYDLYVGHKGLLSSSINLITYAKVFKLDGIVNVNGANLKVDSLLNIVKDGALIAKDSLSVYNPDGRPTKTVILDSAEIKVVGSAEIKSQWFLLKRGDIRVEREAISGSNDGSYQDHKWGINMNCYKEVMRGHLGPESKVVIGGNLFFDGNKIENVFGRFDVGGAISYARPSVQVAQINNLKVVGEFTTWGYNEGFRVAGINEARVRLDRYCGLDSQGLSQGTVYKPYEFYGSPVADHQHSAQVEANNIRTNPVYMHNHHQRPFVDQRPAHIPVYHAPQQQVAAPSVDCQLSSGNNVNQDWIHGGANVDEIESYGIKRRATN